MNGPMQVTTEDLAMLLGAKDIEIFFLQKQLAEAQKRLAAAFEPKPEAQPDLKVVPQ